MPTGDQAIEEGGEAMVVEDLDLTVRRQAGRQQLRPESEDVAIPIGIHRWVKYKLSLRVRGYQPQDRSLTGVAGRCLGHGCQATAQRAEHPRTAPSCCTRVANPRTPDDAIRYRPAPGAFVAVDPRRPSHTSARRRSTSKLFTRVRFPSLAPCLNPRIMLPTGPRGGAGS